MESLIDSDGRILLPAELCRKHGIRPGMKVILTDLGDAILLLPVTTDEAQQIEDEPVEPDVGRVVGKVVDRHLVTTQRQRQRDQGERTCRQPARPRRRYPRPSNRES